MNRSAAWPGALDARLAWTRLRVGFAVLAFLLLPTVAVAGTVLQPPADDAIVTVTGGVDFIEDTEGRMSLDEVAALPDGVWKPAGDAVNFGYTRSTVWIRLQLALPLPGRDQLLLIDNTRLSAVDFHVETADGKWRRESSGAVIPWERRTVKNLYPMLHIGRDANATGRVLIRVWTDSFLHFGVQLAGHDALAELDYGRQTFVGLYYGIVVALLVFNLVLFVANRDAGALLFTFFLGSMTLTMLVLNGMANPIFGVPPGGWPRYLYALDLLTMLAAMWFARSYLRLAELSPRFGRMILGIMGVFGAVLPLTCTSLNWRVGSIVDILIPVTCLVAMTAGVRAAMKGAREAWFYLSSWGVIAAAVLVFDASGYGLLARTWFTENVFQLGSAAQMILLAVGLADRYSEMRRRSLGTLRRANEDLDHRVRVRTEELSRMVKELESEVETRLEAERALREQQLKTVAAARMAALGQMAGGIAHEINNPLQIIDGRTMMLEKTLQESFPDAAAATLDIRASLVRSVARVARIVGSMRSLVQEGPETGFSKATLQRLVDDALNLCGERFRSFGVELSIDVTCGDQVVECRPQEISEVLLNLLNNAFDAVETLDKKIVGLSARIAGQMVEFEIENSGPPIPEHVRERLFSPFFTTKEPGRGTGLGLGISAKIAHAHHGSLALDLDAPRTRFVLRIPLTRACQKVA